MTAIALLLIFYGLIVSWLISSGSSKATFTETCAKCGEPWRECGVCTTEPRAHCVKCGWCP
jgi:hypothetical protein